MRKPHAYARSHAPSTAEILTFHDYSRGWPAIVTVKRTVGFRGVRKDTSRSLPTRRKGKSTPTGQTIGTVADTKDRMVDTASGLKEQVKDLPTNARYAVYSAEN